MPRGPRTEEPLGAIISRLALDIVLLGVRAAAFFDGALHYDVR
jgi:hypothetical protein